MRGGAQPLVIAASLVLLRAVGVVLSVLPGRALKLGAVALTVIWAVLLPVRRSVARQNLAAALPDHSPRARRWLLYRTVSNLAWAYLEFLMLPVLTPGQLVGRFRWRRLENLEAPLKRGRGVLVLSAHLGAFDLLAAATAARGLPVTVVSRTPRSRWAEALWMPYRRASGMEILSEKGSLKQVLRALRSGRIVALVLDQNMNRDRGVFVRFFGRPACTLDSLAVLALRTRVPVVPAFTWRAPDGRHEAEFHPELELIRTGDMQRDILENTQQFTALIEEQIRLRPEQWLWLHRRWKTRPTSPATGEEVVPEPVSDQEQSQLVLEPSSSRNE